MGKEVLSRRRFLGSVGAILGWLFLGPPTHTQLNPRQTKSEKSGISDNQKPSQSNSHQGRRERRNTSPDQESSQPNPHQEIDAIVKGMTNELGHPEVLTLDQLLKELELAPNDLELLRKFKAVVFTFTRGTDTTNYLTKPGLKAALQIQIEAVITGLRVVFAEDEFLSEIATQTVLSIDVNENKEGALAYTNPLQIFDADGTRSIIPVLGVPADFNLSRFPGTGVLTATYVIVHELIHCWTIVKFNEVYLSLDGFIKFLRSVYAEAPAYLLSAFILRNLPSFQHGGPYEQEMLEHICQIVFPPGTITTTEDGLPAISRLFSPLDIKKK